MPKRRTPSYRDPDFARVHNTHLYKNRYTLQELHDAYRGDPRYAAWDDDKLLAAVLELAATLNRMGVAEWRGKLKAWSYCIYLGDFNLVDYLNIVEPHNPTPLQAAAHERFDDTEVRKRIRGVAGVKDARRWIDPNAAPCVVTYRAPEPAPLLPHPLEVERAEAVVSSSGTP